MACPFFIPENPITADGRFPLGDAYLGRCVAGEESHFPTESQQRELCNCGYARGRCSRFPVDSADAYRFSVVEDLGEAIRIVWVAEREHAPLEHGSVNFPAGSGVL